MVRVRLGATVRVGAIGLEVEHVQVAEGEAAADDHLATGDCTIGDACVRPGKAFASGAYIYISGGHIYVSSCIRRAHTRAELIYIGGSPAAPLAAAV